jgi:hypothetical protein
MRPLYQPSDSHSNRNRTKSDKEARAYLGSVKAKFPNALLLQSIPLDEDLWAVDSYVQFL